MKIAFLGDSLTAGNNWQESFPEHDIANFGVNGDKTYNILDRLEKVLEFEPNKILVMMGINDFGDGRTHDMVIANYEKLISKLKGQLPNCEIYLQSVLPVNKIIFKNMNLRESEIIELNKKLPNLAQNFQCEFINLFYLFNDNDGRLDEKFTPDGLHLNSKAYQIWIDEIENKIA